MNWVLIRAKVLATFINNFRRLKAGVKSQVLLLSKSKGRCEVYNAHALAWGRKLKV
jgi:hypothetical protein